MIEDGDLHNVGLVPGGCSPAVALTRRCGPQAALMEMMKSHWRLIDRSAKRDMNLSLFSVSEPLSEEGNSLRSLLKHREKKT